MLQSKNYDFQFADEETETQGDEGAWPRSHNCTPGGLYKQVKVQTCLRSSRSAKLPPMAHRLFLSLKVSTSTSFRLCLPSSLFYLPVFLCVSLLASVSVSVCVSLAHLFFNNHNNEKSSFPTLLGRETKGGEFREEGEG